MGSDAALDILSPSDASRVQLEAGDTASMRQSGASTVRIQVETTGKAVTAPSPIRIRTTGPGMVSVRADRAAERRFRGEIEIVLQAGGLWVINVVDVEDYLMGTLPAEMGKDSPMEALKAQAVASRTTALRLRGRHRGLGFDLCSAEHCQVYAGADSESPATTEAVEATRGEVLTYENQLAQAVFSAICGGHTENNEDVWPGHPVPYLRGKPDNPASEAPKQGPGEIEGWVNSYPQANCLISAPGAFRYFRWVRVMTQEDVQKSLAPVAEVGQILRLTPLDRGVGGRVKRLEVAGTKARTVLGPEAVIRAALGKLPSAAFVVDAYGEEGRPPAVFVFRGAGLGHGVGMCQMGAVGLARAGLGYREILGRYYPGCEIQKMQ